MLLQIITKILNFEMVTFIEDIATTDFFRIPCMSSVVVFIFYFSSFFSFNDAE